MPLLVHIPLFILVYVANESNPLSCFPPRKFEADKVIVSSPSKPGSHETAGGAPDHPADAEDGHDPGPDEGDPGLVDLAPGRVGDGGVAGIEVGAGGVGAGGGVDLALIVADPGGDEGLRGVEHAGVVAVLEGRAEGARRDGEREAEVQTLEKWKI